VPLPAQDEYARNIDEFRYEDKVADGVIAIVGSDQYDPYSVAWWSPDPRLVMKVGNVHAGRHVRKRLRRGPEWATTADHSFQRVAEECRYGREPRWLTDRLVEALIELHRTGWAHSIEVWEDTDLVGGAIGIGIGAVFSGDSMFSRRPNAARVAVADLAARLADVGGAAIDAQWDTPFLRSLGAELLPRERYLELLAAEAPGRLALPTQAVSARRLLSLSRAAT
jgi:leucyl/phenylalanyl-tRNA--protein transferase